MSANVAPDSWEQQADAATTPAEEGGETDSSNLSAKFSTLNVNAVEFVPSFCLPSSQGDQSDESPEKSDKSNSESPKKSPTTEESSPVLNGKSLSTFCVNGLKV